MKKFIKGIFKISLFKSYKQKSKKCGSLPHDKNYFFFKINVVHTSDFNCLVLFPGASFKGGWGAVAPPRTKKKREKRKKKRKKKRN